MPNVSSKKNRCGVHNGLKIGNYCLEFVTESNAKGGEQL